MEGIVEQRVGNQAAWIDCFFAFELQRVAVTALYRGIAPKGALQLVLVERFDISPMVLVEVSQLVVQQYRWT